MFLRFNPSPQFRRVVPAFGKVKLLFIVLTDFWKTFLEEKFPKIGRKINIDLTFPKAETFFTIKKAKRLMQRAKTPTNC